MKEAELKREVRPCGHAIGSGEHYCGTSERVEGEESERHGSETSIENGSGSGTTSSSGTSSSSPATEDMKTSDITPTARDIHPPQGPRAFVRKDNDVDSEAIGLKRSCPNAPASMRAEKRVKLGIDGYVPDGPKSARTLADVFSRKEREARERAEQARKEEREKERRKREDKMLGEDVRRKEDAWKAARGKVAGCEWDIVVIKADVSCLPPFSFYLFDSVVLTRRSDRLPPQPATQPQSPSSHSFNNFNQPQLHHSTTLQTPLPRTIKTPSLPPTHWPRSALLLPIPLETHPHPPPGAQSN